MNSVVFWGETDANYSLNELLDSISSFIHAFKSEIDVLLSHLLYVTHTHILRLSSSLTYFQREWWKMPNFPGHPPLWRKSHSSNLPECCAVEACVRQVFWNSEAAFQRPCTLALTPPSTHVQSCVWTVLLLLLPRKDRPGQRARILSSTERRECGPLRAEELMGTPRQRQDSDVHIQAPETLLIIILFSTSYLKGP